MISALIINNILNLNAQQITGFTTTNSEKWVSEKKVSFVSVSNTINKADITIFPSQRQQQIDGVGGCFNELGWEALNVLPDNKKNKVLLDLFSPQEANFSLCRVPVGASDYALSWYSYNDVPDDYTMRNFNIDRDRYILIPFLKAAKKLRPDMRLWASPWSPPLWMKVNNSYALRSGRVKDSAKSSNEMDPHKDIINNATAFKMEKGCLEAYALYLSKYIKEYKKEGVDIDVLQVQNEIAYAPQWASCTWRAEDISYFIKKHLGPQFQKDSVQTQIWLGTINWGDPAYVRNILNDSAAAKYIKGVGFQWAGKKAIGTIHAEFPNINLMQSESECGNGENNWLSAEHTWALINHYINNGAHSYMYWNMVLDKTGESRWGWPQNMLISINKETKEVVYNPEYYLLKHLGHFLLPGAVKLKTSGTKDHLAFMNPDGSIVLMIVNTEKIQRTITIGIDNKVAEITVKPNSFNTYTWKP